MGTSDDITSSPNAKPFSDSSPKIPCNIKSKRKLVRAESLEDMQILAVKKKPSIKKKKKSAKTTTTTNDETTTAGEIMKHDSTDGVGNGFNGGNETTKPLKKTKKTKKNKKSLTSELMTSSPFTDSNTPEQMRAVGVSGEAATEIGTMSKTATMGGTKKKKTKKTRVDVQEMTFQELNSQITPD